MKESMSDHQQPDFKNLQLSQPVLQALNDIGYEKPSPIQASAIPLLIQGDDVLGQAQTGTGKTAAFALPILSKIDLKLRHPQCLVLAPTRELAIQVAEAFQSYAAHMEKFHVLPIYGGQEYGQQIRNLKRGVHVVVGTPGRVMDHIRKGTLQLQGLTTLVLDEADEMLRMGFIDDVEWILQQLPSPRQTALFSATMPDAIKRIAQNYLNHPREVKIKVKTTTASTVRQRYWEVSGVHKLDALTRILEVEPFEGMIIFVRTKLATDELAAKLAARGFNSAALNGDVVQKQREQIVSQFKAGNCDILVATDVVARGLDVDRVSHVINYDIPYDTESYVHRIGRTGRAGRHGDAILFVSPRERRMLKSIQRATGQQVERMHLPSTHQVNDKRIQRFQEQLTAVLADNSDLENYINILDQYQQTHNIPPMEIAAGLMSLLYQKSPLLLAETPDVARSPDIENKKSRKKQLCAKAAAGMERYILAVGSQQHIGPGNIVGAIANEAGIDSQYIGQVQIQPEYSLVDLPVGMPAHTLAVLKKTRVGGKPLKIKKYHAASTKTKKHKKKPSKRNKQSDNR